MSKNSRSSWSSLDIPAETLLESLREAFAKDLPEQKFVLPYLIPCEGNVIVGVGPDVDPSMWCSLLVYGVTTGRGLMPFGKAEASPALCVGRPSSINRAIQNMKLILEKDSSLDYRDLAADNMLFFRGQLDGYSAGYLNVASNLRAIESEIPDGCKVVFFYDGEFALLRSKNSAISDDCAFASYVRRLNNAGIATMTFYRTGKHGAEPLLDQLLPDGINYYVNLTVTPEAPCEFGAGFSVFRKKTSEFDIAPAFFQVWHMVIDRKLSFGWEIRDQSVPKSKNVEMIERQMRVKQLLDVGMAQKDIASFLNVDASTISRDTAKVKRDARKTENGDGEWDDLS